MSFVSFDDWRSSVRQARREAAWEREEREWRAERPARRAAELAEARADAEYDSLCWLEERLLLA